MLRNRKEQTEPKLVGVNRVADPTKLKLGTFQALQNWIPAKRYKIKKKRGVEALVDSPPTPVIPTNCGVCISAVPAAQDLPTVCCYDNTTVWGLASDLSGSLNYVNPADLSFWATSGLGSGFGSGPYPDDPTIKWKLWASAAACALTDISSTLAVPFTGFTADIQASQAAQAGRSGHSDEKSYVLEMANVTPAFFSGGTEGTVYFGESSGAVPMLIDFPCSTTQVWTKYGSDFFSTIACSGSGNYDLARWPTTFSNNYYDQRTAIIRGNAAVVGSPVQGLTTNTSLRDMFANANYLYVLVNGAEYAHPKIMRINKSNLTFITSWELTDAAFSRARSIHVFSDDLIFILNWNDSTHSGSIGFLDTTTGDTLIIDSISGCTGSSSFHASNTTGFHYANNYFFIGDDGGNVLQVGPLLCPGSPGVLWES